MTIRLSALALLLPGLGVSASAGLSPALAEDLAVPSGQPVRFLERLTDRPATGPTARFRFVAPDLAAMLDRLGYAQVEADLSYLCESYALPRLGEPRPSLVVISLSAEPTEFADPAPEVAQVFEAYRPVETGCEWEAF
ncbi:DUF6497 family protein [Celeribacter indicus]|uniref:Acetolactate synthase n=1 Tax=Celeribacter indicus TaxID=1208324 RepID=A0A0B5E3Z6_9RHOB|nr:DUF6497 family protein [Celeribacter indicus]AJE48090.1 hypothetical protein P73_3375 [Celeribacter indicus]SDW32372.1 hypothetical protein SAMN05443573_102371 [Celeribacter indicus]